MKTKKRIFTLLVAMFMFLVFVSPNVAYAEAVTTPTIPTLTATPNNEGNYISINWNMADKAQYYSYMLYSKKSNDSLFQSIPSKSNVKVLNIYPGLGNNLKTWMETNGYGKGLISVDQVDISTFNSNPNDYLKDSSGNWKYDVVFIGAWNANATQDITQQGADLIKQFIQSGRGYLGGHDTIWSNSSAQNTRQFRNFVNIKIGSYYEGNYYYPTGAVDFPSATTYPSNVVGNQVEINKKGLLTSYPWDIGSVGTVLNVPISHTTAEFAYGDVWLKYAGKTETLSTDGLGGTNNFYLTTWNNTAQIQTGHSNGEATPDEQKILANTLFYLAQVTEETNWDDHKGQDLDAPTKPNITSVVVDTANNKTKITFDSSRDNGTTYDYYVEATGKTTGTKMKSDIKTTPITSGLKGYAIVVDKNPSTVPKDIITTTSPNYSINGAFTEDCYIHVAAIDTVGNVSEVSHYKYVNPVLSMTLTPSTTELQRNPVTITAAATSTNTKITKIQTPDGKWVEGATANYVVSVTGDYTFTAVDELGNEITQKITVTIKSKPVLSMILTPSTTELQRNPVTITATATSDNTTITKIQTADGNWVNGSTVNYIVNQSGTYNFTAIDSDGNKITQSIAVTIIPKPVLSMLLKPSTTELQRNPVTIKAVAISNNTVITKIQTPDGNWIDGKFASYVVSQSGTYSFTAVDDLGNKVVQSMTVNIIPKPILSMTLTPSTTELQRDPVTITAAATSDNTKITKIQTPDGKWVDGSTTSYVVNETGNYIFTAVDELGNEIIQSITVNIIPKPILSMLLTPSTTELQRNPVTITATATSDNTTITRIETPDGKWVDGATANYTVSETGNYTFTAVDDLGNEIIQSITVKIIPKPVLSMTLAQSTTELQRNPVTITAAATSTNTKIVKIQTPDGNWVDGATANYVVNETGDYTFTAVDELENKITEKITVTIIPKPVLSMTLTPSTTIDTNGPVTITATAASTNTKIVKVQTPDGKWIDGSTADYVVSTNGTYKFTAVDELGYEVTESVEVNNIFKVVLNIEPERNRIHLNETVTANLIIDNIKEIAAEDIRIKYDTTKLQFLGYEQVDGIKLMKSSYQNGELRFILVSKGLLNVVNSKTILLKLKFKGIAPGDGLVDVTKGRVSDGILMEKNLKDVECGQVNINVADEELIDVNDDGEFSLLDLGILGRHLGENPEDLPEYNADVVLNDAIDDEDLAEVVKFMLLNPNYNF